MKIFISLPMKNKTEKEWGNSVEEAREVLYNKYGKDIELVIPYELKVNNIENYKIQSIAYIGNDIMHLANRDKAYFCKGWETHEGCMIERFVCMAYGIEII